MRVQLHPSFLRAAAWVLVLMLALTTVAYFWQGYYQNLWWSRGYFLSLLIPFTVMHGTIYNTTVGSRAFLACSSIRQARSRLTQLLCRGASGDCLRISLSQHSQSAERPASSALGCSSGQGRRKTSNQSMKPTAPLRSNFSLVATTPCRGLSLSRWMLKQP